MTDASSMSLTAGAPAADHYLDRTIAAAVRRGFRPGGVLPLLSVCRDEMAATFTALVRQRWGNPFQLGGLGGLPTLGRTGMEAAAGHAPHRDRPDRFVAYLLPHIGLAPDGAFGWCLRPGQSALSTACGALVALRSTLKADAERPAATSLAGDLLDPDDPEQALLGARVRALLAERGGPEVPELLPLTELLADAIVEDFTRLRATVPALAAAEVIVFAGVLVHAPGRDLVLPRQAFVLPAGTPAPPGEPLEI